MSATPSLARLAADYATSRTPESLARLDAAVVSAPTHDPGADPAATVAPFLAAGDHAGAAAALQALMPGAFLSPAAHAALAVAHDHLGDPLRAARERRTARLAMAAILDSGDGSAERPWRVLRISDEYDVLRAQDRTSRLVADVTRGGRRLDHHRCADGTEAWFDTGAWR